MIDLTETLKSLKKRLMQAGYKSQEIDEVFEIDADGNHRNLVNIDSNTEYEIKLQVVRDFSLPLNVVLDPTMTIQMV